MKEDISDNIRISINKTIHEKELNEQNFINHILLLYELLKELEKELFKKNIYNERDKNFIESLFSLLYFELTFLHQLRKIGISNALNKNNYSSINDLINSNKEIFSKKIEQFLLLNNEKYKNFELYKNYMKYAYNNNKNQITKSNFKKNSSLKKRYTKNNKKIIKCTNKISNSNNEFYNIIQNKNSTDIKNKKIQIENMKKDIYKNKNKYLYESTSKITNLDKSNNNDSKIKKNCSDSAYINRNGSYDKLKINKNSSSNNELNNFSIERNKNLNNIKNENQRYSKNNIKCNKTINNFNKKSHQIHMDKSKDNFSNNDISSLFYSSYDEKEANPIRKVKNIIIKVRNKNISSDFRNSYLTNKEKENNYLNTKEIIKEENYKKRNDCNLINKSGFLFEKAKSKENIKINLYKKERETKEILYDCMNQIQKKLSLSEKNKF